MMRLSEAIRLGAMLKPQIHGEYSTLEGSCALGAACDAAGSLNGFREILMKVSCVCPGDVCWAEPEKGVLSSIIIHLNDAHLWTREQIADWVESMETWSAPAQLVAEPQREGVLV